MKDAARRKWLRAALEEVARFDGRNRVYWWRRRAMFLLAEQGLVETYRPPSLEGYRGSQLPYRITAAGRAALNASPSPSEATAGPLSAPDVGAGDETDK